MILAKSLSQKFTHLDHSYLKYSLRQINPSIVASKMACLSWRFWYHLISLLIAYELFPFVTHEHYQNVSFDIFWDKNSINLISKHDPFLNVEKSVASWFIFIFDREWSGLFKRTTSLLLVLFETLTAFWNEKVSDVFILPW